MQEFKCDMLHTQTDIMQHHMFVLVSTRMRMTTATSLVVVSSS